MEWSWLENQFQDLFMGTEASKSWCPITSQKQLKSAMKQETINLKNIIMNKFSLKQINGRGMSLSCFSIQLYDEEACITLQMIHQ